MSDPRMEMTRVIGKVLAETAFICAEPCDDAVPPSGDRIAVAFSGSRSGVLELDAPRALGAEIADNLAGAGDDGEDVEALRELSNVLAGTILPELFGTQAVHRLGIPGAPAPIVEDEAACSVTLETDEGHRIRVRLKLEDQP